MNIIVCLDDKKGMMFNCRRQSMDRMVRDKIREITQNHVLWMNAYTTKQFLNDHVPVHDLHIADDFLRQAAADDYCFVEGQSLKPYEENICKVCVFNWNRVYPADRYFDLDLNSKYELKSEEEFTGTSHDKIVFQIFVRKELN